MKRKYESVGIDLGTTYSAVAYIDLHGEARVVQNQSDQRPILPSVVYFDGDEIIIGEHALQQAHVAPKQVLQFVKRDIGLPKQYTIGGQQHTPESISALVLKKVLAYSEPVIGEIKKAVLTVPAFFNEKRRSATEHAGKIAGIDVVATLNEPTAALVAHELHNSEEDHFYAVYDLGGGTFDVTIMRVGGGVVQELATGGNRELGGIDWDRKLVDHVADEFVKARGADPRDDAISYQTLFSECRNAKQVLSELKKRVIACTHAGQTHRVEVTREKFEQLTRRLLAKTETTIEACLRDAELTWDRLDNVILVGGSTRMPMVRNMLQRLTGSKPLTSVDPDLSVALGAARYAAVLETGGNSVSPPRPGASEPSIPPSREAKGAAAEADEDEGLAVALKLVNSHGIGVFALVNDRKVNVVMIPKNSPLPKEATKVFRVAKDDARNLKITISEGDLEHREACEVLGTCRLGPFPQGTRKGTPVTLRIGYGDDGRVIVSASCEHTKVEAAIEATGILKDADVELEREKFSEIDVL